MRFEFWFQCHLLHEASFQCPAPAGRGFTSCASRALYVDLSLSGLLVCLPVLPPEPCHLQISLWIPQGVLHGKWISDCFHILPDSSSRRQRAPCNWSRFYDFAQNRHLDLGKLDGYKLLCYFPAMGNKYCTPPTFSLVIYKMAVKIPIYQNLKID